MNPTSLLEIGPMMKKPACATPSSRAYRGLLLAVGALATMAIFPGRVARADLFIEVLPSSDVAGQSGYFDIVLRNDGGDVNVGGFGIEVTLPTGSGLEFTSATTDTAAPYIFGTYQSSPDPFYFLYTPTDLSAVDTYPSPPGEILVASMSTLGLARVFFTVSPTAPIGPVDVSFFADGTVISDKLGNAIPSSTIDGVITVRPVPEPSSLAGLALGAAALVAIKRRRWSRR